MVHRISRRTFGAGLALGLPLAVLGQHATAQTPEASLVAVGPHELRDTLIDTPFEETYREYSFQGMRWWDVRDTPYFTAVGGITIQVSDTDNDLIPHLGAYVVYLDDVAPNSAMFHARNFYEDQTIDVIEQSVEGHQGETIVYQNSIEHDLTLVPVNNVLVIGYDSLTPRRDDTARSRSVEPTAILLRHLIGILKTPT